jgi:hypothetical protein
MNLLLLLLNVSLLVGPGECPQLGAPAVPEVAALASPARTTPAHTAPARTGPPIRLRRPAQGTPASVRRGAGAAAAPGDITTRRVVRSAPFSHPAAAVPSPATPTTPAADQPADALPADALPVATLPVAALPVAALPVGTLPVGTLPVGTLPVGTLPVAAQPGGQQSAVAPAGGGQPSSPSTQPAAHRLAQHGAQHARPAESSRPARPSRQSLQSRQALQSGPALEPGPVQSPVGYSATVPFDRALRIPLQTPRLSLDQAAAVVGISLVVATVGTMTGATRQEGE